MEPYAIRTVGLSRDFASVRALDNLSIEVPTGSVFGFLGPNGAGKTTTIRLLLGLLEPSGGTSEVLGFDTQTQADEIRYRSGALLEHNGLYERLSAENNLEFYGRVWRLPANDRQTRIRELLTNLDLWEKSWPWHGLCYTDQRCSSWTNPPLAWIQPQLPGCAMIWRVWWNGKVSPSS
jgi:ABC-2 type transport system ATP-binding protein